MRRLISDTIAPILGLSDELGDAATVGRIDGEVVITTDSYVVSPLFFPGGDIGSLAVFGTVNDLVMSGAKPLRLTLSLIIEEGFSMDTLRQLLQRIAEAADRCGVSIVCGDTKVVPSGAADGIFINTAGIGVRRSDAPSGPRSIQEGDALIVSGPIGRHGIAVLSAREQLRFSPEPESDCAPLHEAAYALQSRLGPQLRAMRDATRGGVAAVLHEWSGVSGKSMSIKEALIPVTGEVRGVCELLGLDPLHVANEGTFVTAVAADCEPEALEALQSIAITRQARVIGTVVASQATPVLIEGILGSRRAVDEPSGAPLPRIC